MDSSSDSELIINVGVVKRNGREETYSVLFDEYGVTGIEINKDRAGRPQIEQFAVPWSDIRSITRRSGITAWGMIVDLASGDSFEMWVLYEHQPASFFEKLQDTFGSRAQFHAEPPPLWKVLVLPVILAALCAGGGSWLYESVRDAEAKGEQRRMHWFIALFGSTGVLLLVSFLVLFFIGYGICQVYREIKGRGRA